MSSFNSNPNVQVMDHDHYELSRNEHDQESHRKAQNTKNAITKHLQNFSVGGSKQHFLNQIPSNGIRLSTQSTYRNHSDEYLLKDYQHKQLYSNDFSKQILKSQADPFEYDSSQFNYIQKPHCNQIAIKMQPYYESQYRQSESQQHSKSHIQLSNQQLNQPKQQLQSQIQTIKYGNQQSNIHNSLQQNIKSNEVNQNQVLNENFHIMNNIFTEQLNKEKQENQDIELHKEILQDRNKQQKMKASLQNTLKEYQNKINKIQVQKQRKNSSNDIETLQNQYQALIEKHQILKRNYDIKKKSEQKLQQQLESLEKQFKQVKAQEEASQLNYYQLSQTQQKKIIDLENQINQAKKLSTLKIQKQIEYRSEPEQTHRIKELSDENNSLKLIIQTLGGDYERYLQHYNLNKEILVPVSNSHTETIHILLKKIEILNFKLKQNEIQNNYRKGSMFEKINQAFQQQSEYNKHSSVLNDDQEQNMNTRKLSGNNYKIIENKNHDDIDFKNFTKGVINQLKQQKKSRNSASGNSLSNN